MGNEETKKYINNNKKLWQWNDFIMMGEKQTHHDRMTRSINED